MKILLIYPYFLEARIHAEEISVPPQGIFYVAAALRAHRYDVDVLNWHDVHRSPETIRRVLGEAAPDVIGFSILHANRWGAIEIAAVAKTLHPAVKIVFGGIGASYLWQHLLTHFPVIDYVVIGEGEVSFLKLLQHLEAGDEAGAARVAGIACRRGGAVQRTECDRPIADLDALPNPARFFTYQHLSLTRGCPGNCTFCGSPQFWGRRVRFHSPRYFVDQIALLHERGVNFFFFSDDTFTINKTAVIDVCREILDRRLSISWQAISRVDMVDAELLGWMRRAGCIQISYGVESGSPKIRRLLNKNYTDEQIERAFALTTRYGIFSRAYFIYGCPGESRETVAETIALMERIRPLGAIFYILDLFPGTALYERYQRQHGLTDDIWLDRIEDILYFETDPALSREQVLEFGRTLRNAFYAKLPEFVADLQLVDIDEMVPLHADFLSRLAMTFDQGDYARVPAVTGSDRIAARLYRQALAYHPDPRAYLGLGIGLQKEGRYRQSIELLSEGIDHFPADAQLHICIGISHMNLGEPDIALSHLLPYRQNPPARPLIADCYRSLGQTDRAAAILKKTDI